MDATLNQEEVKAFLQIVDRFARGSLAPLVERHEIPLTTAQIEQLTHEAQRLGLLNLGTEPGLGLWENLDDPSAVHLAAAALARLAQENASFAWHLHQLAFGRRLGLELGFTQAVEQSPVLASVQGCYGLGRHALPRYLLGADLTPGDRALLADYFIPPPDGPALILHQLGGWRWLLVPFFEDDCLNWALLPRESLACQEHSHSHGLDELTTLAVRPNPDSHPRTRLTGPEGRLVYAQALQVSALALMAVALGAVRRAYSIARDYAALRVQGGTTIDRLPAVQHMLAGLQSALQLGDALLENLSQHPPALERTADIFAARSRLQPMLSQAASDAMQVMGGIGYMQDTGIEKALRAANQLRLMHGTPGELALFIAEWERLS